MHKATVILFAFALFVAVEAAPQPCDDCDGGDNAQMVVVPRTSNTNPTRKVSFGDHNSLGPLTAAMKTVEDTFDHLVGYAYNTLSGSANGGARQAATPGHETVVVAPVPVKTSGGGGGGGDDGCDSC